MARASARILAKLALTFVALAGLSACADRPFEPQAPLDVARWSDGWLGRADGERLAVEVWPARGRTRAVVLALHGFGDAGPLTYEGAAEYWAARGITVYAVDQRGFGANSSRRKWPGVDALTDDAVALADALRTRHANIPLIVVGHSMGGGVALAATAKGLAADGLVLAAPAISGGPGYNPIFRAASWSTAVLMPERRWTGDGIVDILPSDNIEAMYRVVTDPRHFADPSSRELYGLVKVMDAAAEAAPQATLPTLTLMGEKDELLAPEAVRRVHESIPGAQHFILYPEGWHWLFRDRQAERVWRDVAEFVLSLPAP